MRPILQITAVLVIVALSGLSGCIVVPLGGDDHNAHEQRDHHEDHHDENH